MFVTVFRNLTFVLTNSCNFKCKYCCRDYGKSFILPSLTDEIKSFLSSLTSVDCDSVGISGGEPLLCFDKVKELFSYVPSGIHKKVMTNGYFLTQDIVDYFNDNNIEVHFSHDGKATKFLRGVDVLDNSLLCQLVSSIQNLHVFCVVTNRNPDVWENYFYTSRLLNRSSFEYDSFPISDNAAQSDLVSHFDYDVWLRSYMEFLVSPFNFKFPWRSRFTVSADEGINRPAGFMLLLDGTICGCLDVSANFGNILDNPSWDDLALRLFGSHKLDYCLHSDCQFHSFCRVSTQCATPHICQCRRLLYSARLSTDIPKFKMKVRSQLPDIILRYSQV